MGCGNRVIIDPREGVLQDLPARLGRPSIGATSCLRKTLGVVVPNSCTLGMAPPAARQRTQCSRQATSLPAACARAARATWLPAASSATCDSGTCTLARGRLDRRRAWMRSSWEVSSGRAAEARVAIGWNLPRRRASAEASPMNSSLPRPNPHYDYGGSTAVAARHNYPTLGPLFLIE